MSAPPRVVIGISGASGAEVGFRIVERLALSGACETHLVITEAAERTLAHEAGPDAVERLTAMASRRYRTDDIGACIASGSFRTAGMIVAPCSMHSLAAIACSAADNLLVRAADVHLKERQRLVLLARESPLHLGHIRAMAQVTEMGAIVAPLAPAFYLRPQTVSQLIDHLACRAIDLLRLEIDGLAPPEWQGDGAATHESENTGSAPPYSR